MKKIDVITVDGPAGAGKSSATKELARRLGVDYLNTGAMYRAIALKGVRLGIDLTDEAALTEVARSCTLESLAGKTYLDGEDVTDAVRAPEISKLVRFPANAPKVREIMVEQQRNIGLARPIATEGRDQGTVVFPDAACKFYLTASAEERARRRVGELLTLGASPDYDQVLAQIVERDRSDSEREVGPLTQPSDAIVVDSTNLSLQEAVAVMEVVARNRLVCLQR